jgi:hypothetical protein
MAPTNAVARGVWTAQNKNDAKFGRQLMQMLFENNDATPMNGTRSGVVPTTGLTLMSDLLVYNVVGLTMNVAPGWAIAHRSGQGPYPGTLDAVASIACDTAPASNPRNDLVVMRVYDAAIGGDTPPGGNPCRIEVITGTPAASPADPMTVNAQGVYTGFSDGAGGVGIPLARAQVSTSGVITLTDLRKTASVVGAVRLMLPGDSDSAGRVSQMRYTIGTDLLEIKRSDGSWYPIQTGTVGIVGAMVGDSGLITADAPGTWASATKVLSNVVTSFSAVAGAKYEITAPITWTCSTASNQDALGIVWRAGAGLVATDALAGYEGPRTHPDGTGFNSTVLYGTFTAVSAGTHNVGVIGWKPTGNTGTSQIRANGTWTANRITVKRVG